MLEGRDGVFINIYKYVQLKNLGSRIDFCNITTTFLFTMLPHPSMGVLGYLDGIIFHFLDVSTKYMSRSISLKTELPPLLQPQKATWVLI